MQESHIFSNTDLSTIQIPNNIAFVDFYRQVQCFKSYYDDAFFPGANEFFENACEIYNAFLISKNAEKNKVAAEKLIKLLSEYNITYCESHKIEYIKDWLESPYSLQKQSSSEQTVTPFNFIPTDILLQQLHGKEVKELQNRSNHFTEEQLESVRAQVGDKIDGYVELDKENSPDFLRFNNRDYALYQQRLGKGTYGEVRPLIALDTNELFVIKIVDLDSVITTLQVASGKNDSAQKKEKQNDLVQITRGLNNEVAILKKLEESIGAFYDSEGMGDDPEKTEKFFIGMQYAPGVPANTFFAKASPPIRLVQFALATVVAIQELHAKNILHRDIKPDNLHVYIDPVTDEVKVTIVDYGFSRICEDIHKYRSKKVTGTYKYMAPEIKSKFKSNSWKYYNTKTEVFSWGRTLADILQLLWDDDIAWILITDPALVEDPPLPKALLAEFIALIEKTLDYDSTKRPSFAEIYKELKKIENNCLHMLSKMKTIGIIDYRELNAQEEIQTSDNFQETTPTFRKLLSQCDQVFIYNPHKQELSKSIQEMMQFQGIKIAGVIEPLNELPRNADDYFAQIGEIPAYIESLQGYRDFNSFFYLTNTPDPEKIFTSQLEQQNMKVIYVGDKKLKKSMNNSQDQLKSDCKITTSQFQVLIGGLRLEIQRQMKKIMSHVEDNEILEVRIQALRNAGQKLTSLYRRNELSQAVLHRELNNLQKEMIHTNIIKRYLSRHLNFTFLYSTSEKNIHNLDAVLTTDKPNKNASMKPRRS